MEFDNNPGKGKTMLVPVIAIALFMMLVFGATFAYFNASTTTTNVANVKATIPQAGTTLTTNATPCVITVDAANMTEAKKGTVVGSSTCWVEVSYTAATGVVCTYDVKLTATGTAYAKTTGATNEFTGRITSATGANGVVVDKGTETQMDSLNGVVVAHATVTGTGSKITQKFTFEEIFRNINADQGDHAGQTYTYNLGVTNVKC